MLFLMNTLSPALPMRVNYQPAPAGDAQAVSDTEKDADADPV